MTILISIGLNLYEDIVKRIYLRRNPWIRYTFKHKNLLAILLRWNENLYVQKMGKNRIKCNTWLFTIISTFTCVHLYIEAKNIFVRRSNEIQLIKLLNIHWKVSEHVFMLSKRDQTSLYHFILHSGIYLFQMQLMERVWRVDMLLISSKCISWRCSNSFQSI